MTAYLLLNAVMYAVFALWCTFRPHTTARFLGYELPGPPGLSEYTAVYGGLEAGLAAFFALAIVRDELRTAAVIAAVCLYAGLFCFRTIVVARHGRAVGKTLGAYVAELALLVWGLTLLGADA
jgi:hypothetical protein